jgi:hypothetical protein
VNRIGEKRLAAIQELEKEMLEWTSGRRSHINTFMQVEWDQSKRTDTLVAVALADAAEVQKLSAAIQAEAVLAKSLGWT